MKIELIYVIIEYILLKIGYICLPPPQQQKEKIMTDFSMGFQGLSQRAQKFIAEKIDDGDGKINTAERNKIADYLNGKQELPAEYCGVKDELEQFGRNYDVQAARSGLFVDEAEDVTVRGMSDKDMNQIDTIRDYNTMKAIADGKLEGYTPQQQAYAKALLENSAYARERMLKTENTDLKTQNQKLLEENEDLKSELVKLTSKSEYAKEEKKVAQEAKSACDTLFDEDWGLLKSKISGPINKINSATDTIIKTCKNIEDFASKGINSATIEKSIKVAEGKIEQQEKEIEQAKKEGQKILEKELPKTTKGDTNSNAKAATALGAIQKLFTGAKGIAGGVGAEKQHL